MTLLIHRRRFDDQNTSFLLRNFEDFYLKLVDYQTKIFQAAGADNPSPETAPQSILNDLRTDLETMSLRAGQQGGEYTAGSFQEAMYIMASLTDEFFITLDWEGRRYWADHLLESALFNTHDAGDLFFKKLDYFLSTRDPMRYDLGEIYLMALGLGFQGKYRNTDDQGRLKEYRTQLYRFIYHQDPPKDTGDQRLFPEVYGYTLQEGKTLYFQDIRQWMMIIAFVFGFLLLLSAGIWMKITAPLKEVINHISSLSTIQE